ncbi:hypothetical protein GOODEAATRI_006901, partial [Goodea atripinnis]
QAKVSSPGGGQISQSTIQPGFPHREPCELYPPLPTLRDRTAPKVCTLSRGVKPGFAHSPWNLYFQCFHTSAEDTFLGVGL